MDDIFSLLKYIEEEHGFTTDENILKDLAKFQVFLLTTRGQSKEIKSENFEYDWKNYFVNGIELSKQKKLYIYKNKVIEENPHKWSYKTIWYGRRSRDFKCNPEELQEDESEIKVSQIVQNSN